jgi:hypothetical protein
MPALAPVVSQIEAFKRSTHEPIVITLSALGCREQLPSHFGHCGSPSRGRPTGTIPQLQPCHIERSVKERLRGCVKI